VTGRELGPAELARLREIFDRIPYARLLGLEFVGAARGEARFALGLREELTRNEGLMHGGAVASLMDTASAFAVMSLLEPGQRTVTIDLTIHFLRPVTQGRVEAHARVLRAGRRITTLTIEATDQTGKLLAAATTTYFIQTDPPVQEVS
jgi:acyl-CoA thioesterase